MEGLPKPLGEADLGEQTPQRLGIAADDLQEFGAFLRRGNLVEPASRQELEAVGAHPRPPCSMHWISVSLVRMRDIRTASALRFRSDAMSPELFSSA